MPGVNVPYFPLKVIVYLALPICLLASRLPRRPRAGLRAAAGFAGVCAVVWATTAACILLGLNSTGATVRELVVFSVMMMAFAGAIVFTCQANLAAALFCATAGYTLQNLTSGLELLGSVLLSHSPTAAGADYPWLAPAVLAVVYTAVYLLVIRRMDGRLLSGLGNPRMIAMFAVVSLFIIGVDILFKSLCADGASFEQAVLLRLVHTALCAFVLYTQYEMLYNRRLQQDRAALEQAVAASQRQYELSRANIEAINVKCHDIRHQIRAAQLAGAPDGAQAALDDLASEVSIYDSFIQTGCDALDVILTEKSLTAAAEGIELSCIADGSGLAHMAAADIYSLFGNALDNALEAARSLDEPDWRTVSLVVQRRGAMTSVRVENYVRPGAEPDFVDGVPQTTKADRTAHGFGMRSMQLVAERYGGSLAASCREGVFRLSVLVPSA